MGASNSGYGPMGGHTPDYPLGWNRGINSNAMPVPVGAPFAAPVVAPVRQIPQPYPVMGVPRSTTVVSPLVPVAQTGWSGQSTTVSDVNGDGIPDFATTRNAFGGTTTQALAGAQFLGGAQYGGAYGAPYGATAYPGQFGGYGGAYGATSYPGQFGGNTTTVSDVNGDGIPDFATTRNAFGGTSTQALAGAQFLGQPGFAGASYPGSFGATSYGTSFPGASYPSSFPQQSFAGASYPQSFGGQTTTVSDVNGDGIPDFATTRNAFGTSTQALPGAQFLGGASQFGGAYPTTGFAPQGYPQQTSFAGFQQ